MWWGADPTPPERLIFDYKEFVLSQISTTQQVHKVFHVHKAFKTQSYTLTANVKEMTLGKLKLQKSFSCDLFANHLNAQERLYCTRQNSAFKYNWSKLCQNGEQILWANSSLSQVERVLTKIVKEPCKNCPCFSQLGQKTLEENPRQNCNHSILCTRRSTSLPNRQEPETTTTTNVADHSLIH